MTAIPNPSERAYEPCPIPSCDYEHIIPDRLAWHIYREHYDEINDKFQNHD